MKASIWGLLIAAVAFGASTIYLSLQLNEERAQAEQLAEADRGLNARIAELESAREQRFAVQGSFNEDSAVQNLTPVPVPSPAGKDDSKTERAESFATIGPPPRSEAFQKMMRSQMRANNKRIYADLGAQLGLSKEDTSKLIDMLTDQQAEGFARMRDTHAADPAERKRLQDEVNRENQAELEDFLGVSKVAALRDYQETIPARQEMEALARQLEGADASLNADQQKRLLTAFVDERKRIPMPKMSDYPNPEDYSKAYTDWQSDYNERVNSQARGILNTDQMTAYSEYQQWQKEMREQVAARRQGRATRILPGGNVEFSIATPVAGEAVMLTSPAAPPGERPRDGQ
jgi:superfamily II DNA helicase RecQ